jgi:PPM family protein phosphatase
VIKLTSFSTEKQPHSTIVALVLTPERSAFWAHVGDSRLYRFSGPNCVERTIDHSYVEKLVREGKLARKEAASHRFSNVLLSALGSHEQEPEITLGRCDRLEPGDAFLLCSDGLWHYFTEAELGAAVAMNSPRAASEMLVAKARERAVGTEADNCTMAIVKLAEVAAAPKDYVVQKMARAV